MLVVRPAGGDVHLVETEGVVVAGDGRVTGERVGYELGVARGRARAATTRRK